MFQICRKAQVVFSAVGPDHHPGPDRDDLLDRDDRACPFKLAIDFTGGTLWEMQFDQAGCAGGAAPGLRRQRRADDPAVTTLGSTATDLQVRLKPIDEADQAQAGRRHQGEVRRFPGAAVQPRSVRPSAHEVTQAAVVAVAAASIVILGFLIFAFRKVPNPFRYGAGGHHRHAARPAS